MGEMTINNMIMNNTISDTLLSRLSEWIASQTGISFTKNRWPDLERIITHTSKDMGFDNAISCTEKLLSSSLTSEQFELVVKHLTIGETYFFREKRSFEIFEENILPKLIKERLETTKRIRLWSAACATGEEPYSIAISLLKLFPELKGWDITILATDINPLFIQKAEKGVYSDWSFRDTSPEFKTRYFKEIKKGYYKILPHIRKMVTFAHLNLAKDTFPSYLNNTNAIDVVFCRNVLMYFVPDQIQKVINGMYNSLIEGGWFIVSPTETSILLYSKFASVSFEGATIYLKDSSGVRITQGFIPQPFHDDSRTISHAAFNTYVYSPDSRNQAIFDGLDSAVLDQDQKNGGTHEEALVAAVEEPAEISALYPEAVDLCEQGRYADAVNILLDIVSSRHDNLKAVMLLARAYANQGKLDKAFEWSNKASEIDKMNPGVHYLNATIMQEQGKIEDVIKLLKKAVYLDHNFIIAHFMLGNNFWQLRKTKESERHFKNALLLLASYKPDDTPAYSEGVTAGRLIDIINRQLSIINAK